MRHYGAPSTKGAFTRFHRDLPKKLYAELKAKEQTQEVKEMLKACNSLNKLLSAIVQLESQAAQGGELLQYNQWVGAANRQIKELDAVLSKLR